MIPHTGTDAFHKLNAQVRLVYRRQHAHDRKTIPVLWYWRLMGQESSGALTKLYGTQDRSVLSWRDPIPAYLYIEHQSYSRRHKQAGVEVDFGSFSVKVSEAERYRLAQVFHPSDESQWGTFALQAGDLFLFGLDLFQVEEFSASAYYGPLAFVAVWKATVTQARNISNDSPLVQLPPTTPTPPSWPAYPSTLTAAQ